MKLKGKKNTEIVCLQSPEGKRSRTIQRKPSVRRTGRVGGKLLGTGLESQRAGGKAGRKSWEAGSSTAEKRWRSGDGWQQGECFRSNRWQQSALDLAAVAGKLQPERKEPKQDGRTTTASLHFHVKVVLFIQRERTIPQFSTSYLRWSFHTWLAGAQISSAFLQVTELCFPQWRAPVFTRTFLCFVFF